MNPEWIDLLSRVYPDADAGHRADQACAGIAAEARKAMKWVEEGVIKPSEAKYWAVERLELCASHLCRPPPVELVKLVEMLLGVAGKEPRNGRVKNPEKWVAAINYVADHPEATSRMIARAIGSTREVIDAWLKNRRFEVLVENQRIANRVLQQK